MKKHLVMLLQLAAWSAIVLGVLEARPLAAAAEGAVRFCASHEIDCPPGYNHAVQLARRWQPIVDWRFDRELSGWQIKNYQEALTIEAAADAALDRSLIVHRDGTETDTAFELTSPPIPVVSGTLCRLTIAAAHTLDLSMAGGHQESFQNQIRWLDPDGRTLEATPFRFAAATDAWYNATIESRAPRSSGAWEAPFDTSRASRSGPPSAWQGSRAGRSATMARRWPFVPRRRASRAAARRSRFADRARTPTPLSP